MSLNRIALPDEVYSSRFYDGMDRPERHDCVNNILSAVMEMLDNINSVVDFGCGNGSWLLMLKRDFGVNEIFGVDGEWAQRHIKAIKSDQFMSYNLEKPIDLQKKLIAKGSKELCCLMRYLQCCM